MNRSDRRYADMADREEGRDHDVRVAYQGRVVPSEGAFGRAWMKFHAATPLVYVDDAEGRPRGLAPKQYEVLKVTLRMADGAKGMTIRAIAEMLECAPSTVSRAIQRLQSFGLIAVIVGRGRYAGLVIFRRVKGDGLDRFRDAAKARVRRWSEAANRRVSRLWVNVAPYILRGEGVPVSYQDAYALTPIRKSATLKAWTPEELREAGII